MSHKAVNDGQFSLFDETVQLRQIEHVDSLPKTAQALVDVIGIDATIDLVKMFAGDEIKIPEVVDGTSRMWAVLVECVGREAAVQLVGRFGGVSVYVAKCEAALKVHRNREIIQSYDAGEPFDAIRRRYKFSRSYLFRLLKKSV
ncbi:MULTISPECIES: Mor transcription activator family protein [unclassified Variovorax]|jgi:Mor family transcriptional regulator|uniref:Mor transcription activator family protein n=1 Tax=unclassified Variovorax TaxID=663243 RepID=UPI000F7F01DA|nr:MULTISPECIES: Mor transcription activator family protein [unclassified Variovorax]RSZ35119.1 hypothetical protein EJO70_24930 [Variovorax sp. 553]RSZ35863.1 hypothetical protein EJO71_25560 [Variovorax sp. 679]